VRPTFIPALSIDDQSNSAFCLQRSHMLEGVSVLLAQKPVVLRRDQDGRQPQQSTWHVLRSIVCSVSRVEGMFAPARWS
jgi:hypothetical protein